MKKDTIMPDGVFFLRIWFCHTYTETRRCVIPASGFYEWSTDKRKCLFRLPDAQTLYMAGIYEQQQDECRYCILTTEANESVRGSHPRMPVVLQRERKSLNGLWSR